MSQHSTLFGVVLGAAIVGATLIVRDALEDPQTAEAVRTKVKSGYTQIKNKVGEGYSFVRDKVQEGCAAAREKAGEAGESIRTAVENAPAVQKIKKTVKDIRRAAEPAEAMFAEAEEAEAARKTDNTAEVVVETEAGMRDTDGE